MYIYIYVYSKMCIVSCMWQASAYSMLKAKKKAERAEKQLRRIKEKALKGDVHERWAVGKALIITYDI